MLAGFLILVLCQWLGEGLVAWLGWPVPGPVVGMLILFAGLVVRGRLVGRSIPAGLEQASGGLIQHLSLFFLPAGIGIAFLPAGHGNLGWPLALVIIPGTVIALLVTALVWRALLARTERR